MNLRPLRAAVLATLLFASSALAVTPPEFYGSFIVLNEQLIEVSPTTAPLKMKGNLNDAILGYEQVQGTVIQTLKPQLVLYQQHVESSAVTLSRLAWVNRGAVQNLMTQQPQTVDVNLYVPVEDIKLKIKPMGEDGMFLFQPAESLPTGYFAIHYGGLARGVAIGKGGDVYLLEVRHPRQDEIVKVVEDFVRMRQADDFEGLAEISYTLDRAGHMVAPSESELAATKKVRNYLVGGALHVETIREQTDESGTFLRVETPIEGKVFSFTVVGQPDTGPHAFYVRDVGGQMKVFVHGQHWMFQ